MVFQGIAASFAIGLRFKIFENMVFGHVTEVPTLKLFIEGMMKQEIRWEVDCPNLLVSHIFIEIFF